MRQLDTVEARRIFLGHHGLADAPSGPGKGADLMEVIEALGFVQVDSINTVARAHHMILHSRRTAFRPGALDRLLNPQRALFEHWTHDAAIIPMAFWPYWRLRFARDAARLATRWESWHGGEFRAQLDAVLAHIRRHGASGNDTVAPGEARQPGGWWAWTPSKTALEYLWRSGTLSLCHRTNFRKRFDLTERVVPAEIRARHPTPAETIDWAARSALDRLGFATPGELAAFWKLITPAEAKAWCAEGLREGRLEEVALTAATGQIRRCLVRAGANLEVPTPPGMMRVLSPFDPLLRDRHRAARLFGFHYRIEVFVPAPRRTFGYYVFPLLEGDRMVGRIDMKADRDAGCLRVTALWPEQGLRFGRSRMARLDAALARTARLAGCSTLSFADGWLREPVAPPHPVTRA